MLSRTPTGSFLSEKKIVLKFAKKRAFFNLITLSGENGILVSNQLILAYTRDYVLNKRLINMWFVSKEAHYYKLSEYIQFVKFRRTFVIVGRKTRSAPKLKIVNKPV